MFYPYSKVELATFLEIKVMKRSLGHTCVFLVSALFLFAACSTDDDDTTREELKGDVLLSVGVYEDADERIVSILAETVEDFSCSNYNIDTDTKIRNGELTMCCKEIIKYTFCDRTIGPATYKWDLGNAGPGEYPIEVQIGKEKSLGTLVMEEDTGYLKFDELNRIQLQ